MPRFAEEKCLVLLIEITPLLETCVLFSAQAPDGFRGTYEQVVAHEKTLGIETGHEEDIQDLYQAPDGFRGTYDEVVAHEEKLGFKYCEETGTVKPHSDDVVSVESVLNAEGVGLGEYVEPFHQNGVNFATELSGCTDTWLAEKVGLTSLEQLAKFREVVVDNTASLPATAQDGFKGTESDVKVHELKLAELAEGRMEAAGAGANAEMASEVSSAKIVTPPPAVEAHHDLVLMRIYEAEDGFRGTYDEVVAHEEKLGLEQCNEHEVVMENVEQREQVLMRIYEAEDGFRGTYDEVLEHENKLGFAKGSEHEVESETVLFRIYKAPDGFMGTYDEVKAYEGTRNFKSEELEDPISNPRIFSIYRCDDGFRGTYEECVAHENEPGYRGLPSSESPSSPSEAAPKAKPTAAPEPSLEAHHHRVLFRVYEAEDGFRGTYDEVVAHEASLSGSVAWLEPTAVKEHLDSLESVAAKQQDEIEKLKALIAQY